MKNIWGYACNKGELWNHSEQQILKVFDWGRTWQIWVFNSIIVTYFKLVKYLHFEFTFNLTILKKLEKYIVFSIIQYLYQKKYHNLSYFHIGMGKNIFLYLYKNYLFLCYLNKIKIRLKLKSLKLKKIIK